MALRIKETMPPHKNTDNGPPMKRRKLLVTASSRPVRKRPLEKLVDMPIDILFEIFGHLNPSDLLSLSRATKATRNLLMHHSSITIWRAARRNLPEGLYLDIPDGMSEPEYSHLLFDHHCHFCLTRIVKHPFWAWRVRCCKECLPKHFTKLSVFLQELRTEIKCPDGIAAGLLTVCHPTNRSKICYNPALQEFKNAACKADDLMLFTDERCTIALQMHQRVEAELDLVQARESFRVEQLMGIKEQRIASIKRKLCELGWEKEFNQMTALDEYSFRRHALVTRIKPLTDRAWANIRDRMVDFMKDVKSRRQDREFIPRRSNLLCILKVWRRKMRTKDPTCFLPEDEDIIHMAPFNAILRGSTSDVCFASAMDQLPELCTQWRQEKDQFLLSLMEADRPPSSGCESNLALATTSFRCMYCPLPVSYPRILNHLCMGLTQEKVLDSILPEKFRRYTQCLSNFFYIPWNAPGDFVQAAIAGAGFAGAVIQAAGEDPTRITAEEMDSRDVRWICDCGSLHGSFAVCFDPVVKESMIPGLYMNWRMAVRHMIQYPMKPLASWTLLDGNSDALDAFILKIMTKEEKKCADWEDRRWCCLHCDEPEQFTPLYLIEHLLLYHQIMLTELTEEHCYRHPDSSPLPLVNVFFPKSLLHARERWLGHWSVDDSEMWMKEFEKHPEFYGI